MKKIKKKIKRLNTGRWTQQEKDLFVKGLKEFDRNWVKIADMIKSRDSNQVRSHAQKYFLKEKKSTSIEFPSQLPPIKYEEKELLKVDKATQYGEGVIFSDLILDSANEFRIEEEMFFLHPKSEEQEKSRASTKKFVMLAGLSLVLIGIFRAVPILTKRDLNNEGELLLGLNSVWMILVAYFGSLFCFLRGKIEIELPSPPSNSEHFVCSLLDDIKPEILPEIFSVLILAIFSFSQCLFIYSYEKFSREEHIYENIEENEEDFLMKDPETAAELLHNNLFETRAILSTFKSKTRPDSFSKYRRMQTLLNQALKTIYQNKNIYKIDMEKITQNMDEHEKIHIQEFWSTSEKPHTHRKPFKLQTKRTEDFRKLKTFDFNELYGLLKQIGKNWNFDMFFLNHLCGHKPILTVARYTFTKFSIFETFGTLDSTIINFFSKIEGKYKNNPYHNSVHAADVTSSFVFILNKTDLIDVVIPLEILGAIIANLSHDVGHPALNNRFLVTNLDELAIRYNDTSVLEMMHAATVFEIMRDSHSNLLKNLDSESFEVVRKIIIDMILATDMSRHFDMLGNFRARAVEANKLLDESEDRLEVMKMAIKAADISHAAKEWDLHEKWSYLLVEEFFTQGDLERERGFKISMYCDRFNTHIPKCQAGFIKNIALPLFESLNMFLNSDVLKNICVEELKENEVNWEFNNVIRKRKSYTEIMVDMEECEKEFKHSGTMIMKNFNQDTLF